MKAIAGAFLLWTAFVIALWFLDPGGGLISTTCGHMVPPKPAHCPAEAAAIAEAYRRFHSDPMVIAMASGYLVIAALTVKKVLGHVLRPRTGTATWDVRRLCTPRWLSNASS